MRVRTVEKVGVEVAEATTVLAAEATTVVAALRTEVRPMPRGGAGGEFGAGWCWGFLVLRGGVVLPVGGWSGWLGWH